jgi:hypothetical protein
MENTRLMSALSCLDIEKRVNDDGDIEAEATRREIIERCSKLVI